MMGGINPPELDGLLHNHTHVYIYIYTLNKMFFRLLVGQNP